MCILRQHSRKSTQCVSRSVPRRTWNGFAVGALKDRSEGQRECSLGSLRRIVIPCRPGCSGGSSRGYSSCSRTELLGGDCEDAPSCSESQADEIIFFLGLDPQLHEGMKEPSRELLDDIAPNNAILVGTSNTHGMYINTKALAAFGIDADYVPPPDGNVFKAADALPCEFEETAAWQVMDRFFQICGEERKKRSFEEWIQKFVRAGYTTTSEIGINPGNARTLQAAVKSRPTPLRIIGYESSRGDEITVPLNFGDDDFRMIGVKLWRTAPSCWESLTGSWDIQLDREFAFGWAASDPGQRHQGEGGSSPLKMTRCIVLFISASERGRGLIARQHFQPAGRPVLFS